MTKKADFNAEEWSLLLEAPPIAALIVTVAERGGMIRESMSVGSAYAEARKGRDQTELLEEILSEGPELGRQRFGSMEEARSAGQRLIREAADLVDAKATTEEAEDYKRFIVTLADTVAHAKKEGGVLGIGGKPVSDRERAVIEEIAATLGTEPPPTTG